MEERGTGDVWTLTVDEYLAAPRWKRMLYRGFRHPLFLLGVAPAGQFLVTDRFPLGADDWHNGEKASVWWTNAAILAWWLVLGFLFGFGALLITQLPVILIAGTAGTWMFYVQHQFERTYWEHTPEWNYTLAAMHGSSYLQTAACIAVVHGQHRLPSHPPPQPAYSQLQAGRMS